ncbi:MAG: TIGR03943 family putative permease subunit [Bacillota bacterium]
MELDLRMARIRDLNALMRAVLLLAWTAFLAKLVLQGELSQYIHPKFTWFTSSAGIGLFLMAIGQLRRWFRGTTGGVARFRYRLYAAVTAVVCTGFLLQPHTFGADLATKQGLNVTNRSTGRKAATAPEAPATATAPEPSAGEQVGASTPPASTPPASTPPASTPPASTPPASTPPASTPGAAAKEPAPAPPVGEVLQITPQNFVQMMFELYDYPEKYAGKRVVMEGFVFHPPDLTGSDFAVVRLVVTCHVAHAYPDGLVAYLPGQERPKQDLWYRVEGQLEPWTYREKTTLKLKIERATPLEKPADPYVYP